MRKNSLLCIAFLLTLLVATDCTSGTVFSAQMLLAQSAGLSQDEAAARVRQNTGGRVLSVQTVSRDGVPMYLVKVLLPDGRVRVVKVR